MDSTVSEVAVGVWLIDFPTAADVVGERCGHLVPPLAKASLDGPIVMMAKAPPDLRLVDPSMTTFWLRALTSGGVKVSGIAVVTQSAAVRAVVKGVGLALGLRANPIVTATPRSVQEAIEWGSSVATPRLSGRTTL